MSGAKLHELLEAAKKRTATRKVKLPELLGEDGQPLAVWVRAITGAEGLALSSRIKSNGDGNTGANAALFLHAYLCEEDGTQVVPTVDDASELVAALPLGAMNRIVDAGQRLNSIHQESPEALEKN